MYDVKLCKIERNNDKSLIKHHTKIQATSPVDAAKIYVEEYGPRWKSIRCNTEEWFFYVEASNSVEIEKTFLIFIVKNKIKEGKWVGIKVKDYMYLFTTKNREV